jgi:hypothetical protein
MRTIITAVAATVFFAACASVPASQTVTRVYDHKTNLARSVATAPANEFVGTSASAKPSTAKPSWYAFGHP